MSNQNTLLDKVEIYLRKELKYEIPEYIKDNLKHNLWGWQEKAMHHFEFFDKEEDKSIFDIDPNDPTHLMFNMATGTGKTLLMAALVLYYYKKGYRHFMFFTNQNVIIGKTEENFINKYHPKYLFNGNIVIDDKTVNIRKVETFDNNQDDIQIQFTSIHKIHNAIYIPKENQMVLEELQKMKIVMIGDESHHLNATTMKSKQKAFDLPIELKNNAGEAEIAISWENTIINQILKKGKEYQDTNNENVLLEFTATIPQKPQVIEKYRDKTIYKFELVDFVRAGYTKEINLVYHSLDKKGRILIALLFNWYRHQIALKNNIPNFKPVILFKSKYIKESRDDYELFLEIIANLASDDFDFLSNEKIFEDEQLSLYEQTRSRFRQLLKYIEDEDIKIQSIIDSLQYEFREQNCIITNSKDNKLKEKEKTTDDQEKLLNSLEDINNPIRAIFTVKRLTEGWDVLNLFDIVRLYKGGRDEYRVQGGRAAGKTTTQEVQLIGRGVRYCPFAYKDDLENKRKFDRDLENPMRILEEFYYHSEDNRRYIDELKRELKNKGLIQDDRTIKKFSLKDEFKERAFYKEVKIWQNEKINNPDRQKTTLMQLKDDFQYEYKTKSFSQSFGEEHIVPDKDAEDEKLTNINNKRGSSQTLRISNSFFDKHIIAKAINIKAKKDLSILRFENLQKELKISTTDDILKPEFIGDFGIMITHTSLVLDDISNQEKLDMILGFLEKFMKALGEIINPYIGSGMVNIKLTGKTIGDFKYFSFEKLFGQPKEKSVDERNYDKEFENNLLEAPWYILDGFQGTSEEKHLIKFIEKRIANLDDNYLEWYILKNEEVYKIYDAEGRGFAPDFLLFLKGKDKSKNLFYQIFIEPKGGQFKDKDAGFRGSKEGWKEEFLQQITNIYSGDKILLKAEDKDYKLIGLPFFNHSLFSKFEKKFNELLMGRGDDQAQYKKQNKKSTKKHSPK